MTDESLTTAEERIQWMRNLRYHRIRDGTSEKIARLIAHVDALEAALEKIKAEEGKVCANFELCKHASCQSSYGSWAIADAALSGRPLWEDRHDG